MPYLLFATFINLVSIPSNRGLHSDITSGFACPEEHPCLNPLKSGPAFGPLTICKACGLIQVSIPSNRGLHSDVVKKTIFRHERWSQSPQIGACIRTNSFFAEIAGDRKSQSPQIGACIRTRTMKATLAICKVSIPSNRGLHSDNSRTH